jgi:pimeloyl-ACP methyl ester carboxylesterase
VDEVLPEVNQHSIILGHDFGGVIAAMVALRKTPRAVILTGTALGPWWSLTRLSAKPMLDKFFYDRYAGELFVQQGNRRKKQYSLRPENQSDLPERMKKVAKQMRPPSRLAQDLAARCPVYLIWGKHDRWYPPPIAKAIRKATKAKLFWMDAGHYAMWEQPARFQDLLLEIQDDNAKLK